MSNMAIKKRSILIDIAKGIAIISIVLGHIGFVYPSLTSLIDSGNLVYALWHVPYSFC